MHFGDRLCDVLGDAETLAFLRFVFQTATEGLLSGASHALIHDRIRVALATHFSNEERQLAAHRRGSRRAGVRTRRPGAGRHAGRRRSGAGKRAKRARRFEHDADQLVVETREAVRRRPDFGMFLAIAGSCGRRRG